MYAGTDSPGRGGAAQGRSGLCAVERQRHADSAAVLVGPIPLQFVYACSNVS